jgi:hypothetical protein
VNLYIAPSPTVKVGTGGTFTASATGCSNALYQLWVAAPGGSWQIVQPYSSNATYVWNTTGEPTGNYSVSVWITAANSNGVNGTTSGHWDTYSTMVGSLTP